jgi:hypothetical protein
MPNTAEYHAKLGNAVMKRRDVKWDNITNKYTRAIQLWGGTSKYEVK